jgi:hypothetical protein
MTIPDPICTNEDASHGTHGGDGGPCLGCGWTDPAYALPPDPIDDAILAAIKAGTAEYWDSREAGIRDTAAAVDAIRAAAPILIAAGREQAAEAVENIEDDENRGFCLGGHECGCGVTPDYAARIARGGDA